MSDVEIREGFLCPICLADLGGIADLQGHFEELHSEDKAVLNHLKGLFGKAKRKILGRDEEAVQPGAASNQAGVGAADISDSTSNYNNGGIDPTMWDLQELGTTRDHTAEFKRIRDARIDRFVVETNKLLIRLDKLINSDVSSDPHKRRVKGFVTQYAFEKTVVAWAPDADVNLCTTCGKPFNLTRRRHHCRLCGGIMCHNCSQFLPHSYAKKMTNPSLHYGGEGFHRAGSASSLNSMLGNDEKEAQIRTCINCRVLMERRDSQMEVRNHKPPILQIYERMRQYMDEAEEHLPKFYTMVESLSAGETTYHLQDAQIIRLKVMKLYESIDALSKRICVLGLDAPEQPPPRVLKLQRSVRTQASAFLQDNLLGLQSLPSEDDVTKARESRVREQQRKIDDQRQRANADKESGSSEDQRRLRSKTMENTKQDKTSREPESPAKRPSELAHKREGSIGGSGWKPIQIKQKYKMEDDPMAQQISIIRGYISQAREAKKMDEVRCLEQNLAELQKEFWRQQEKNNPPPAPPAPSEPGANPFEDDDQNNPFKDDANAPSSNPFDEEVPPASENPFEDEATLTSTNPFDESPDVSNPFLS